MPPMRRSMSSTSPLASACPAGDQPAAAARDVELRRRVPARRARVGDDEPLAPPVLARCASPRRPRRAGTSCPAARGGGRRPPCRRPRGRRSPRRRARRATAGRSATTRGTLNALAAMSCAWDAPHRVLRGRARSLCRRAGHRGDARGSAPRRGEGAAGRAGRPPRGAGGTVRDRPGPCRRRVGRGADGRLRRARRKLDALLDEHRIRVVHPVAAERRIVRVDEHGQVLGARRSPKRATAVAVFDKLVAFPSLLTHPNLTIEVLLLREDHIRRPQPTRTRRPHPRSGGAAAGRGPRPGRAAHAGGHPRGAAGAAARAVQHARARGPARLQHAAGAAHALLPADDRDRRAGGQARPRPAARAHGARRIRGEGGEERKGGEEGGGGRRGGGGRGGGGGGGGGGGRGGGYVGACASASPTTSAGPSR